MNCKQCQSLIEEGVALCGACGASVEQKIETDPLLGRVLLNQYVLQKKIGEGGFGAVYLAEQPSMGRKVAIKTLHKHLTHNKNIVARFRREGIAASKLEHPYAVKMLNLGETDDGVLWMAMEFLSGETLEAKIKREGPLHPDALIELMEPICEVLQEAHQKGIIHRDLKPENIMLLRGTGNGEQGTDGRSTSSSASGPVPRSPFSIPRILDFGIAALLDDGEYRTQTGAICGTPKYMPPEQWRGLKYTDARSDIYSLGVIAYQCLSGRLPFEADSVPGWMQQHCLEPPLDLKEIKSAHQISPAFAAVIMSAIEKDPNKRPQSAKEFFESLRRARKSAATTLPEKENSKKVAALNNSTPPAKALQTATSPGFVVIPPDANPPPNTLQHKHTSHRGLWLGVLGGLGVIVMSVVLYSSFDDTKAKQMPANRPAAQLLIPPQSEPASSTASQPQSNEVVPDETKPVEAKSAKVKLVINTSPAGATIFLGKKKLGKTKEKGGLVTEIDYDKKLKLSIKLEDYQPENREFTLAPNQRELIIPKIELSPEVKPSEVVPAPDALGFLTLTTDASPNPVECIIDGKSMGFMPCLDLELKPGTHNIALKQKVRDKFFATTQFTAEVKSGEHTTLHKSFEPKNRRAFIAAKLPAGRIASALSKVNASACSSVGTGTIKMTITIDSSGAVTDVLSDGSSLGNCVERLVRSARFPAISESSQTFSFPIVVK